MSGAAYFRYGEKETDYLKSRDKRLSQIIDRIGPIRRLVDGNLFSSAARHIVGQQISTKAQQTVWARMSALGEVNERTVLAAGAGALQALGMTFKKAEYIADFAARVRSGAFDLDAVERMPDAEAIAALSSLKGIGV